MVDTCRIYDAAQSWLNKCPGNIIVFDSPVLLNQYEGIRLVDTSPTDDILKYKFEPKIIDYSDIIKASKKLAPIPEKITKNKVDLLEAVLKTYTVSGLLDKFNSFLYSNTSPLHRTAVKSILVQFIFGSIGLDVLKSSLAKYITPSAKSKLSLQPVLDYMASSPGLALQKALIHAQKMENDAAKNSRRKIAYKTLANTYGVDSFELRNIILLYRAIK